MAVKTLYDFEVKTKDVIITSTRKDFVGDYSTVVFPFAKDAKKKPELVANEIGDFLKENLKVIKDYNVIGGFVNLVVDDNYWTSFVNENYTNKFFGKQDRKGEKVMVEFSCPNTNKPLHLGHIRNNLLGWSVCQIMDFSGYDVVKVNLVNDRGIHICKSMLAWQLYGNGETPQSSGIKGDYLVGKYYVEFEKRFREEFDKVASATDEVLDKNKYFNYDSALGKAVKEMLIKWEEGDAEVRALWSMMNKWVLDGHEVTYENLGVSFDKYYYESFTYNLGKDIVENGLKKGVFFKLLDNSIWVDLESKGLDKKLLLRNDGTSVYITQDLGTARLKYEDYKINKSVYIVADEQNYHFQVLFEILKELEEPYADGLYHLSYGLVNLPSGRMKSREGTVVDADDLITEVIDAARQGSQDRGVINELEDSDKEEVFRRIGLGALKFHMLKVNPKKSMTFNPEESLDFQGQTGPFVQNAYIRVQSILRRLEDQIVDHPYTELQSLEKELLILLNDFPTVVKSAADNFDPSEIANYCYELAKRFHRFYHDLPMLRAESEGAKYFRIKLSMFVSNVLEQGMNLLGIEMPERM